jgi:hypothetical protein
MSPFREALKAAGHGEWAIETWTSSGDVCMRKVDGRATDARLAIPATTGEGIVLKAAA